MHIYSNWPKELLRLWEEKRGFALDPIVQFGRTASGPYFWSDAVKNISKNAAHLFDIANSFGLKEGYVVPHRTAAGNLGGGVSIGGPVFPYRKAELEPIHQICKQVLVDLNDLIHEIEPIPLGLSNQEREVLQCAARGESIFATSQILHISVSAVKDAQTRARKKLNAKNTTHACVIATRINLI